MKTVYQPQTKFGGGGIIIFQELLIIRMESVCKGLEQTTNFAAIMERVYGKTLERGMCIKGQIWPPLEPKTESRFSPISPNWFIRRMAQV